MKTKLFNDSEMDEYAILQTLEAENCGVEEHHSFLRPFTEEEQNEIEEAFLIESKKLNMLKHELEKVSAPLKEAIKPVAKETGRLINAIQQGGENVTEKIFLFPDYDENMMGLYDRRGILIGSRAMSRSEKQLHINSSLRRAVND
jgi:hypothetical protein